jgi:uncharacterized protein
LTTVDLINRTVVFVKDNQKLNDAGHDWWHVYRVWKLSQKLALTENCNPLIVELGALLHDICDAKFNGGDESEALSVASEFLLQLNVDTHTIHAVLYIIDNISFRKQLNKVVELTPELAVVMDADRLDAMGAIGIARAFSFGGFKNRPMFDPDKRLEQIPDYETYTRKEGTTIDHFYQKLLHLQGLMNTKTGKQMAGQRHRFMEAYLQQFYDEWEGVL